MTTLICSGTLFSDWRSILKKYVPADSFNLSAYTEISTLAKEICKLQFPELDELVWKPFSPDDKYISKASQLLSSIENEPLFIWDDGNSCLYLNFWKTTAEDAKFVLFYSSPEYELSNYISTHPFDASRLEKAIDAWVIRTRAMQTFFMNNRDRCLLLGVQSTTLENGSFIQAINNQFDLELEPKPLSTPRVEKNSALIEYLATTLLLKNQYVSELYDEVRSAATLLSDQDKAIASIEDRSRSLINAFLDEVTTYKQLNDAQVELEEELSLNQLQIKQMAEELEYYFKKSIEQEKIANTMADYLGNDPLLKIARQARQMQ